MPPAAIAAAVVVGGMAGYAGAQKDVSETTNTEKLNINPATGREWQGLDMQSDNIKRLEEYTQAGPGLKAIQDSMSSNRDLAQMLKDYSVTGGLPTDKDISSGNDLASKLFQARRVGLKQSFTDQETEANRLAARLGRSIDDPIIQAKLRTGFMRQEDALNAEQSVAGTDMAMQLPGQRLNFASARNDLLGGLSAQAFRNRAAMLDIGSGLIAQERNFRLATSTRDNKSITESGGGTKGMINGFIAGASTGASMGMGFPGGGGGSTNGSGMTMAAPVFGQSMQRPSPTLGVNYSSPGFQAPQQLNFQQPLAGQIGLNNYEPPTFGGIQKRARY